MKIFKQYISLIYLLDSYEEVINYHNSQENLPFPERFSDEVNNFFEIFNMYIIDDIPIVIKESVDNKIDVFLRFLFLFINGDIFIKDNKGKTIYFYELSEDEQEEILYQEFNVLVYKPNIFDKFITRIKKFVENKFQLRLNSQNNILNFNEYEIPVNKIIDIFADENVQSELYDIDFIKKDVAEIFNRGITNYFTIYIYDYYLSGINILCFLKEFVSGKISVSGLYGYKDEKYFDELSVDEKDTFLNTKFILFIKKYNLIELLFIKLCKHFTKVFRKESIKNV